MNFNNKIGVLYIATGKPFIAEAVESAKSVKKYMPDIPIALFCEENDLSLDRNIFNYVTYIENPSFSNTDKVCQIRNSPFQKTLFLDTDTIVIEPFYELWELLDRFDLAMAHAPWRMVYDIPDIPECFPEFNTGVILFKANENSYNFFLEWERIHKTCCQLEGSNFRDQPTCRKALYDSNLKFIVLTPEYNLRTIFPYFAGGNAKVKILHGRQPTIDEVKSNINLKLIPRIGIRSLTSAGDIV